MRSPLLYPTYIASMYVVRRRMLHKTKQKIDSTSLSLSMDIRERLCGTATQMRTNVHHCNVIFISKLQIQNAFSMTAMDLTLLSEQ